jgi:hypothetical protein
VWVLAWFGGNVCLVNCRAAGSAIGQQLVCPGAAATAVTLGSEVRATFVMLCRVSGPVLRYGC